MDGTPFDVEVTRYESAGAGVEATTTTETIRVTTVSGGEVRGIEAERSGLSGEWLDLRKADPGGPLLKIEDGRVEAQGTFGPDASRVGSPDLVEGTLRATCPVR